MSREKEFEIRENLRQKGVIIKEENVEENGEVPVVEIIGTITKDGEEKDIIGWGDSTYNALRALQVKLASL